MYFLGCLGCALGCFCWIISNVSSLSGRIPPLLAFSKIFISLLSFPSSISRAKVNDLLPLFVVTLSLFCSLPWIVFPSNIRWSSCPFFQSNNLRFSISEFSFDFEFKEVFWSNKPGIIINAFNAIVSRSNL